MTSSWKTVLDSAAVQRCVERMAHGMAAFPPGGGLALVGIRSRGVPLAARLAAQYKTFRGEELPRGELDITLYRDDFGQNPDWPEVKQSHIPFDVAGRTIVLVDDVLFTGRTIRAALNALMDYGRPHAVRLAVLVDRGLRELPIQPDIVGYVLETRSTDHVGVHLAELDGRDEVLVEERRDAARPNPGIPTDRTEEVPRAPGMAQKRPTGPKEI